MSKSFIRYLPIIFMVSCTPDDTILTTPVSEIPFDTTTATLLKRGEITGVNHTASGTASIYDQQNKLMVVLDPYASQNGPDLKIYLSKDINATEYIRLGKLKSTMGTQSYEVPGHPLLRDYTYLHVWCEKYTVVFARAELIDQ